MWEKIPRDPPFLRGEFFTSFHNEALFLVTLN